VLDASAASTQLRAPSPVMQKKDLMRALNLVLMLTIAALSTALAIYTAPIGSRPLAHWAMTLGMFSSAATASWLFALLTAWRATDRLKLQLGILVAYAACLLFSVIAGGSFGVVYYVMEAEKIDFAAAFDLAKTSILGGYAIALTIFAATAYWSGKHHAKAPLASSGA